MVTVRSWTTMIGADSKDVPRLVILLYVLFLMALGTSAVLAIDVQVQVEDSEGTPIPARVHVRDGGNQPYPGYPDSSLLSHGSNGSYFYTSGSFEMSIPPGMITITVGKGFEWLPVHMTPNLQTDTSLVITLDRVFDMRSEGWFGGDVHVHTQHEPMDYPISPEQTHMIAQAEDLSITWCLDQDHEFTGSAHDVSTPDAVIYYTTEYRNKALGHVSLQGLKEIIGFGCCGVPLPAHPMLSDTYEEWDPQWDEAMILSHPQTNSNLWEDGGWPANGFGRELPVLAALGYLDALDLAAYTNEPDYYPVEWYGLLNCGFQIPASAGTDAEMAIYYSFPPGAYRVYVRGEPGLGNDPSLWVEALKAGQTFITNFPLIPRFEVNGAEAGAVLHIEEPTVVDVSFRIESLMGLESARVMRNGQIASSIPLTAGPEGTVVDTTIQVGVSESSWFALRVEGTTDHPHVVGSELFAHTGAVYVHMDSVTVESTTDAGRFIDWLDSLVVFVDEIRDNWESEDQRQAVINRIAVARDVYGELFHIPPGPFELLSPAEGETLNPGHPAFLDWTDSVDPEPGDAVVYSIDVSTDSTFMLGWSLSSGRESEILADLPFVPDKVYWWRVIAGDHGGNRTPGTPDKLWFYIAPFSGVVGDGAVVGLDEPRLRLWPNPATDRVWFRIGVPTPDPFRIEIIDVMGRRILGRRVPGTTSVGIRQSGPDLFVWDGTDKNGHPLPSGRYWIRFVQTDRGSGGSSRSQSHAAPVLLLR